MGARPRTLTLTIDEILPYVGEYERFQKIMVAIVSILFYVVGYQTVFVFFTTMIPEWNCLNATYCNINTTYSSDDMLRCKIPRNAWKYSEDKHFSMATQWDVDCDKSYLLEVTSAIFFVGWTLGSVLYGWLGDRYGRKVLIYPSTFGILLCSSLSAAMPNIYLVMVCRFVMGLVFPGAQTIPHILLTEFVGSKYRPVACMLPFMTVHIGYSSLALQAYLLKDWRWLSLVCSAPYLWILLFYIITPRSVRWLQAQARNDEAIEVMMKVAKWNKKELPDNTSFVITSAMKRASKSTSRLFYSRKLTLQTLVQGALWFSSALSYYGLQLAADDLESSKYKDFAYLGLVAIPGVMVIMIGAERLGRKPSILACLLVAGCCSLAVSSVPGHFKSIRMVIGITGKCMATGALEGLYVWSAEIYPTAVRSKGTGFAQACARVGCTIAPFAAKTLKKLGKPYPFIAMGAPAVISAILGLYLPETKDAQMVNSVDATENATDGNGNHMSNGHSNGHLKTISNGHSNGHLKVFDDTEMGVVNGSMHHHPNGDVEGEEVTEKFREANGDVTTVVTFKQPDSDGSVGTSGSLESDDMVDVDLGETNDPESITREEEQGSSC